MKKQKQNIPEEPGPDPDGKLAFLFGSVVLLASTIFVGMLYLEDTSWLAEVLVAFMAFLATMASIYFGGGFRHVTKLTIHFSERILQFMIHFYPEETRHDWGEDMRITKHKKFWSTRRKEGVWEALKLVYCEVISDLKQSFQERRKKSESDENPSISK